MKKLLMIFVLSGVTAVTSGQTENPTPQADRLYRQGKFAESLPEYQKALHEHASDPVISYNLGDAYFRTNKYDLAEQSFDKPIKGTATPGMKQRAYYNKGVALSKQKKLEESIAAYKSSLLLNPADSDARINLQKALLEKKKKDEPQEQKENDQKQKQKDQQHPPPQSKLNKKQVEQLLKALDQREQQVQQKMMQNKTRGVTKPDKDW